MDEETEIKEEKLIENSEKDKEEGIGYTYFSGTVGTTDKYIDLLEFSNDYFFAAREFSSEKINDLYILILIL